MPENILLVLIGTKAQFIKTAPILRELDARAIGYRLVYTGQHSETFDSLERAFGTRQADDVLVPGFEAATHGGFATWTVRYWAAVASRLAAGVWRDARVGIVHGDTASTLFGAMTLRLAGIRVAHVEAGLRSPRLLEPFPEELIRRIVTRLAWWHFAPDKHAASNLHRKRGRVVDTGGNTLRDALALAVDRLGEPAAKEKYAVVSLHRNENLSKSQTFDFLMNQVVTIAERLPVKFVLHPATRERISRRGWLLRLNAVPGIEMLERMDYPQFVQLLTGSRFLVTDGGSNQEEAAMLGLPTLLLRRATERPDGLGDSVVLSGMDPGVINSFVEQHADAEWRMRAIEGSSPSKCLVDVLIAEAMRGSHTS